ncbi:MAG TPA: ribosomal-processing cysteine protease Prp [Enterococcus sp.]|nr:ribosomal-processing cysteine protease Prp [Enterococcus sp.]
MIKGTFKRNDSGRIVSYEITGHANAGEYGNDIVCAAVSALAISTVNGIEALAGIQPILEVNHEEGGYLYVEVPTGMTQEQMNIVQILIENLLLGLQAVQEENSEYIQINTQL